MPRRNRNAHAFTIDTDELAAQADALAADISRTYPATLRFLNEIEAYDLFTGNPRARNSSLLRNYVRDYLTTYIGKHPGCQVNLIDAKAVTGNGRS